MQLQIASIGILIAVFAFAWNIPLLGWLGVFLAVYGVFRFLLMRSLLKNASETDQQTSLDALLNEEREKEKLARRQKQLDHPEEFNDQYSDDEEDLDKPDDWFFSPKI